MTHGTLLGAPGVLSQPATIDQEPLFHGTRAVGLVLRFITWFGDYLCFVQHSRETEKLHLSELEIRKVASQVINLLS